MSGISLLLLALLVMAALLGGLIGYAISRLGERARRDAALHQAELAHQASVRELSVRVEVLGESLTRERDGALRDKQRWQERDSAQRARQDALEVHAQSQKHRIEALLEEQRSTEERHMRLERHVVALRHEFGMAARDRVIALPAPSVVSESPAASARSAGTSRDGVVPVLNRRVSERQSRQPENASSDTQRKSGNGVAADSLPQYGDIPVLAEADLPASMDFDDIVDER